MTDINTEPLRNDPPAATTPLNGTILDWTYGSTVVLLAKSSDALLCIIHLFVGFGKASEQPSSAPASLNCPICFRTLNKKKSQLPLEEEDEISKLYVNVCGHVLCYECLNAVKNSPAHKCPECRRKLGRVYELKV
eukprot:Protomagalhaensia_wolfi_Nauph_80__1119@NODE_1657_length_1414_cov_144_379636_g758_i2_p2_GENE_NODE_1657_length_1414_cov_144_379636_g758_i2NODE_1657_length_1414_cov_144_379636_g758_i2_p2_ORF_typecomplete_len135_score16_04ProkRING_4/PF14447_6/9_3ProkRING_4/PF14447_6/6_3e09zfRING_5/PF14634_6/5_8e09zfC3HC4_3/PF13920_6/9_3e07zfC3HC4/PF00097_25/2_7e06zfANAPC11/PF12861_7/2_3e06zfRING_UBOX/PF13445_6/4_1e06zfRING_2/PF13639_6/6_9e06zfC3HC4_2/PF13923_6/3_3e05Rtf2/PF04641_12/0_00017zfRING_4/PF14570_6/0_0072zf